ncbi:ATP-dependent DNA helicase RecQ [Mesobacillus persicus]|uniref:ATP-dependent DNA helicase RecQ n=1 Tax=Mesobacillus persicus TaxID=930146 RepID=A0A1H8BTF9_9BACI|nr:ATP-dependent DNA helicase RecQ [Mesobacillus persicus]SEM86076.1 ATP-dependent DNA helicase RecQ [Mesobacillus persicus]
MELEKALYKYFGFTTFRKGQKEIVNSVLRGKNTLAMLPTGTGKSLCYQLPGYVLNGQVVIISPLLSLMQDQVEQMKAMGEKRVVAINSFLTPVEKRQILQRLPSYKFIFVSPEMLGTDLIVNKMKQLTISLLVIDEAHCISQWGYDFRPDYLKIGDIRKSLGSPLTIALTATATKEVRQDIIRYLQLETCEEFVFTVDRPEIAMGIEKVGYQEKEERALELVKQIQGPGIIYFSSKKLAEKMAVRLRDQGERAMAYHGGLDQEARILIQQQFIHDQLDVVCATSAFGMGINKDNVRFIIHFHMPLQLESYLQEIGRAGRDGLESLAILLYAPGDEQLSLQLAEGELPEKEQINRLFTVIQKNQLKIEELYTHEELLITSCGFSETQWRFVASFITSHGNENSLNVKERLTNYVSNRLQIKKDKIFKVLDYIQQNECKRSFILRYFGERSTSKPKNCCSYCGLNLGTFRKVFPTNDRGLLPFNWKDELASMLLKRVGETNETK